MQLMAAANATVARNNLAAQVHSRHPSLVGLPMQPDYHYGGMSAALGQRGQNHGLPKLETHNFANMDFGGGMRTAPVNGGFNADFDFEGLLFGPGSTTINPNALHYNDSPQSMAMDAPPYHHGFPDMTGQHIGEENFDWMNGFEHQMSFQDGNENAIDGSSPSAISTASQSGISEVMLDGSNSQNPATSSASLWQQQSMMGPPLMNPFHLELGNSGFHDLMNGGPMSPHSLPQKNMNDPYFATPPPSMTSLSPNMMMPGLNTQMFHPPVNMGPETPISLNGSVHSLLPIATIAESTRQALLAALSQSAPFGGRKYSFPATSSPLSPHFANGRSGSTSDPSRSLPSKQKSLCSL